MQKRENPRVQTWILLGRDWEKVHKNCPRIVGQVEGIEKQGAAFRWFLQIVDHKNESVYSVGNKQIRLRC
jgi:hypothetical protein